MPKVFALIFHAINHSNLIHYIWFVSNFVRNELLKYITMNTADINHKIVLMTGATDGIGKIANGKIASKGTEIFVIYRMSKREKNCRKKYLK